MNIAQDDGLCQFRAIRLIPTPIITPCWVLGDEIQPEGSKVMFTSPVLSELSTSYSAKRALWKQIYQYDENFNTKAI